MQEEEVTLSVFNVVQHSYESDSCFSIDLVEAIVSSQVGHTDCSTFSPVRPDCRV